jgi:myo-inositol catabolism protein IolS
MNGRRGWTLDGSDPVAGPDPSPSVDDLSDLLEIGWAETNQLPYSLLWRAIKHEIQQTCIDAGIGILRYSALAQGLLTGKFSRPDEVPEGRARISLFSTHRPQARHSEPGCEDEMFAAIERIRTICSGIGQLMANVGLTWLLHQPGVASVVAGARRPEQIQQTVQAVNLVLSPEIVEQLAQATEEVKLAIGTNPDMWQAESCFR